MLIKKKVMVVSARVSRDNEEMGGTLKAGCQMAMGRDRRWCGRAGAGRGGEGKTAAKGEGRGLAGQQCGRRCRLSSGAAGNPPSYPLADR